MAAWAHCQRQVAFFIFSSDEAKQTLVRACRPNNIQSVALICKNPLHTVVFNSPSFLKVCFMGNYNQAEEHENCNARCHTVFSEQRTGLLEGKGDYGGRAGCPIAMHQNQPCGHRLHVFAVHFNACFVRKVYVLSFNFHQSAAKAPRPSYLGRTQDSRFPRNFGPHPLAICKIRLHFKIDIVPKVGWEPIYFSITSETLRVLARI